jgi:hypothetical protein
MHIPAFNTDFLIIAGLGLVAVYGMMAGQMALIRAAISHYGGAACPSGASDCLATVCARSRRSPKAQAKYDCNAHPGGFDRTAVGRRRSAAAVIGGS